MLPESTLAILARNERWQGAAATEPYEAGWARQAVLFVRALAASNMHGPVLGRVQISPDGMHWVNEGATVPMPEQEGQTTAVKVTHFGGWLRLAADLPPGATLTVIVSLHLKA